MKLARMKREAAWEGMAGVGCCGRSKERSQVFWRRSDAVPGRLFQQRLWLVGGTSCLLCSPAIVASELAKLHVIERAFLAACS